MYLTVFHIQRLQLYVHTNIFFLYTQSILRDFVFLAHFSKEFSAIFWKNCVSDKVIIIRFTDKVGYGRKNQLFERFPCSIYGF